MGATSSTPDQSLRDRLRPLVASVLRVSASDFDDETAFAALGMDSLLAAELTAMVEDEMGIELPASTVLEHASLTALAAHLSAGARAPLGDAGAAADARLARMLTDAVLPDDIVPATRRTPPGNSRRRILLTGATGFIGAHLLSHKDGEPTAAVALDVPSASSSPPTRRSA